VAQKIQTLLIDDIDGSEAEATLRFGLDGASYEIDLSAAHAAELRDALARFITAGRKVPRAGSRPSAQGARGAAGGVADMTEVREWARSKGIEVKDRGRVPAGIVARYREATGK
jgi:nucleoid-associated protein Lsr2